LGFFFFFGLIFYQSNISVFLKDVFAWGPAYIGALLAVIGACDIASRALLLPRLLVFSERTVGQGGLVLMTSGFMCLVLGAFTGMIALLWTAVVLITLGEGLFDPIYNNLLSASVDESKQGQLQGVNQSLHSSYGIFGPLAAGAIYLYTPIAVYVIGAICMLVSLLYFSRIRKASQVSQSMVINSRG